MEETVQRGLFEPNWGLYRNAPFSVQKKNGMYHSIITAVRADQHTSADSKIPPNIEEFSEAITGLPISSLIHIHSGYDQNVLHKDSSDYLVIRAAQGMYWPTRLLQGATISVSSFVRVSWKTINTHLKSIVKIFFPNVIVKHPKSPYSEDVVHVLSGDRRFLIENHPSIEN
jgi:hypothetical protein